MYTYIQSPPLLRAEREVFRRHIFLPLCSYDNSHKLSSLLVRYHWNSKGRVWSWTNRFTYRADQSMLWLCAHDRWNRTFHRNPVASPSWLAAVYYHRWHCRLFWAFLHLSKLFPLIIFYDFFVCCSALHGKKKEKKLHSITFNFFLRYVFFSFLIFLSLLFFIFLDISLFPREHTRLFTHSMRLGCPLIHKDFHRNF